MQEIKLQVEEQNFERIMLILESLQEGLISEISTKKSTKTTQYKPKANTIIKEEESVLAHQNGKYLSPAAYKARLKKRG